MIISRPLAALFMSSMLLGACAKKGSSPESEMATPAPQPVSAATDTVVVAEPESPPMVEAAPPVEAEPAPAPLTDAQIAKILQTVDTGEIDQAKVAQKKSKDARVKKYAQHMIQQHTKSKQKGTTLAKKAKITPEDSPVATELSGKANALLESLQSADAASFDAVYIAGQAQQHQEVLDLVNAQLIPSATHDDLKSLLAETRTMVEAHATQAKEIHDSLTSAGAGADAGTSP